MSNLVLKRVNSVLSYLAARSVSSRRPKRVSALVLSFLVVAVSVQGSIHYTGLSSMGDSSSPPQRTLGTPVSGYWNKTYGTGALPEMIPAADLATGSVSMPPVIAPFSFSWNGYFGGSDYMTPVKDQGVCGSCWAFTGVGAMEAQYQIGIRNPNTGIDLSEQNVLSCSGGNCSGWYLSGTLNFLKDSGTPDEACDPYTAVECSCGTGRCSDYLQRTYYITGWTWISTDTANIKNWLYTHGPVMVWMPVFSDLPWFDPNFWQHYYYHHSPSGDYEGHFVIIVGYYQNDYWIVRNSWGTSGGDVNSGYGGYFYMTQDPTTGFFGIYQQAAVALGVTNRRAWVSGTYLAAVEVGDSWSSGPHGDQSTASTSFTATQEEIAVSVSDGESLLILGSAQLWNGRSDVGTSIAICRDGSRISGDMFALGATMSHRGAATAVAIDVPGAGSFTYSLGFKTDPGGAAWVSATYLLAVKILSSQSSGPHGDQSTTSTSFTPTAESLTVSGSGGTTLLLVASSQIWNDRSDVGSSISIYRDDSIISGDMFAVGAVASHRNIAVAIAIDTVPDNGDHTYSLQFKTDPGGKAWVSATYLALIPISIAYSSGPHGDQYTRSHSFTDTQETIVVSSAPSKYLIIGSSQMWNDDPSVGPSICILREGSRISGDMFTLGAHMDHRHIGVAIAIDQPGTGSFTYALGYKTD